MPNLSTNEITFSSTFIFDKMANIASIKNDGDGIGYVRVVWKYLNELEFL